MLVVLGKTLLNATFSSVDECTTMFDSIFDVKRFVEHCVTQRRFLCKWKATNNNHWNIISIGEEWSRKFIIVDNGNKI